MIWVARITGTLVLLFSTLLGAVALLNPHQAAESLGLAPLSDMGRNSVRADIVLALPGPLRSSVRADCSLVGGNGFTVRLLCLGLPCSGEPSMFWSPAAALKLPGRSLWNSLSWCLR